MAAKKSIDEWEQEFHAADKDKNGSLNVGELRDLLRSNDSKITDSQIIDTFILLEGHCGDKRITLEEFTTGMIRLTERVKRIGDLFMATDQDNNGFLEKDELTSLLKKVYPSMTDADCLQVFRDADRSGDGKISFDEFISACS